MIIFNSFYRKSNWYISKDVLNFKLLPNLGFSLEGKVTFYAENLCDLLYILDIPRKINHISAVTCDLASAKFPEMEIPLSNPWNFYNIWFKKSKVAFWAGGLKFIKRWHRRLSQLQGLQWNNLDWLPAPLKEVICSCRRSGTFEKTFEPVFATNELRRKRRCIRKKMKVHLEKCRAIGECVCLHSCSHLGAFACVSWWNKHTGVRTAFIQVFAWTVIFFSPKKFTGPK